MSRMSLRIFIQAASSFPQSAHAISLELAIGREISRQENHANRLRWPISRHACIYAIVVITFYTKACITTLHGISFALDKRITYSNLKQVVFAIDRLIRS